MASAEGIEEFNPFDWERVDAMVSLGCTAEQDVNELGELLSAAVRDVASTSPDDGGMLEEYGVCPSWPLRAALMRQPIQPDIEAEVLLLAARGGREPELPPRLLCYYMGLLMRVGRPPALTTDRALVRARNAMAAVPGAIALSVLPVPPRPETAALHSETRHFAT